MNDRLLSLTKKLISFRTTASRPEILRRCFDFVKTYLASSGVPSEIFIFNKKPVLYAGPGKKPAVLLCGHLDVVEGTDGQFKPRQRGNRLYGRGALDMKSGSAAIIEYTKNNYKLNRGFGLMLTGDEEVGGFDGVGAMVKKGFGATGAIVIPDGGKSHLNLVIKEKGIIWLKITARGSSAHGSEPWKGQNAITLLSAFLDKMSALFTPVRKHSADHWNTTCNIGRIEGGLATNQVPGLAVAHCDIRYTEQDRPGKILARIRKIAPPEISIETVFNEPMVKTDIKKKPLQAYLKSVKKITGQNASLIVEHGSSDARFFAGHRMPLIISEPQGEGLHGDNEWVFIPSIRAYYDILGDFLANYKK